MNNRFGPYGVLMCFALLVPWQAIGGVAQQRIMMVKQREQLSDIIAAGPQQPPRDPLPWYIAVDVVGVCRDDTALKALRPFWATIDGRGSVLEPGRLYGPWDAPALAAMVRIGLPSVDVVLEEASTSDRRELYAAWFLRALLPENAARVYVEQYASSHADKLDQSRVTRLKKVAALLSEMRELAPRKPSDDVMNHPLVKQRSEFIRSQLAVVRSKQQWDSGNRELLMAIDMLSELRASESAEALAPHVLLIARDKDVDEGALDNHPVAHALSKIGLPAVDPMLQQVIQGDQPEATRDVVAQVLADMMPPEVAVTFVDTAIRSQKNELAKQRLVDLRKTLNKLAEELKEKREKKDLP